MHLEPPASDTSTLTPRADAAPGSGVPEVPGVPGARISRRRFLVSGSLTLGFGGAASAAHAAMVEPWGLCVSRVRVPIRDLPASLHGFRIAQVSDTHLGPKVPSWAVSAAVDLTLSLRPDLIALTGDYVERADHHAEPAAELFRPLLDSPGCAGVVAVMGNHDWYGDGPRVRAALARVGVTMLDNHRVFLDAPTRTLRAEEPPAGRALCIAGVGDLEMDRPDFALALGGVREGTPRILLSHNPDAAELPSLTATGAPRVDAMLSGHTHGGQVRFPFLGALWIPSAYGDKYTGGVAQGPACPVVVSRGVGMSILPLRLNCPPEIVEITLYRA